MQHFICLFSCAPIHPWLAESNALAQEERGQTIPRGTFETLTKLSSLALSPRLFWAGVSSKIENIHIQSFVYVFFHSPNTH